MVGVEPALNEAVTPAGWPARLTVTEPAKPFWGVRVRVLVPAPPCAMLRVEGEVDNVKVGGAVTVRAIVVLAVSAPDVPVMVTVEVPRPRCWRQ